MGETKLSRGTAAKKSRQSNLELLRIVSMVLIIVWHMFVHGNIAPGIYNTSVTAFVIRFFQSLSVIAVNCYVLISGYFLVKSKFKIKRLLTLMGQVFCYSAGIYTALVLTGKISFEPEAFVHAFLPTLFKEYWFVTIYVAMYMLSPVLNRIIRGFSKRQLQAAVCILLFLFMLWPTVKDCFELKTGQGIVWFVTLYLTSAYLRLYYTPKGKALKSGVFFAAAILSSFIIKVILVYSVSLFGNESGDFIKYNLYYPLTHYYNSVFVYFGAAAFFIFFLNIKITNKSANKIINLFAPLTFGVYLIHDNVYIRKLLWNMVDAPSHIDSMFFLIYAVAAVVLIYVVCSAVEKCRMIIFRPVNNSKWLDSLCSKLTQFMYFSFEKIQICLSKILS